MNKTTQCDCDHNLLKDQGIPLYCEFWKFKVIKSLDPNAAIQVEGMKYQPPLIGSKWLLNFKAISYPHIGGLALGLSGFLLLWAMIHQKWANTTF